MSNNITTSLEFTNLCESQITLLSQSLGAVWSVIYLTKDIGGEDDPQAFPFAIYPQNNSQNSLNLPAIKLSEIWQQLQSNSMTQTLPSSLSSSVNSVEFAKFSLKSESFEKKQLILPLVHQDTFIGLLVTGRKDREWQEAELNQVKEIAHTIAIARFLELQYHWTKDELLEQKQLRQFEKDRLEDLLHQLRNPLTALKTFGKLLVKRILPGDANLKVARSLLEQSDRFQDLLEQFETESQPVDSSKSHSLGNVGTPLISTSSDTENQGNFLLPSYSELDAIDLQSIFVPLLNTAQAIAMERQIELVISLPTTIPLVTGDATALREIFNNLIDNALKYTPPQGKILIDAEVKSINTNLDFLGIAIQDTGYGIPSNVQARIFERHYRGIQAHGDIPGTGLGLAIAQELAIKMKGEIELISPNNLASDSPGTTFIVWLPISIDN